MSRPTSGESDGATPAMVENNPLPFLLPSVRRKKVTAAFDGGRITFDGGVLLLSAMETNLGIADTLAPLINDTRYPLLVTHSVADTLRARMLAIACVYEDADNLDHLRADPGFKLACGRLPTAAATLCFQPTVSRWENAPTLHEVISMTYAVVLRRGPARGEPVYQFGTLSSSQRTVTQGATCLKPVRPRQPLSPTDTICSRDKIAHCASAVQAIDHATAR